MRNLVFQLRQHAHPLAVELMLMLEVFVDLEQQRYITVISTRAVMLSRPRLVRQAVIDQNAA